MVRVLPLHEHSKRVGGDGRGSAIGHRGRFGFDWLDSPFVVEGGTPELPSLPLPLFL